MSIVQNLKMSFPYWSLLHRLKVREAFLQLQECQWLHFLPKLIHSCPAWNSCVSAQKQDTYACPPRVLNTWQAATPSQKLPTTHPRKLLTLSSLYLPTSLENMKGRREKFLSRILCYYTRSSKAQFSRIAATEDKNQFPLYNGWHEEGHPGQC